MGGADVDPPEPTRLGEVAWLEPFPDTLLEGAVDVPLGPEARYEQTESISLAFVTALQLLPPRQLAVLVLRDVLGFRASEVAEMLDTSLDSVNSSLKRARSGLQQRLPEADRESTECPLRIRKRLSWRGSCRLTSRRIWLLSVELFTDDVFMSMPPIPYEYEGRDSVGEFIGRLFAAGRQSSLVPTRANGQPAFGAYLLSPEGSRQASGLFAITLAGDRVCSLTRFETDVFAWFGLPMTLPSR